MSQLFNQKLSCSKLKQKRSYKKKKPEEYNNIFDEYLIE